MNFSEAKGQLDRLVQQLTPGLAPATIVGIKRELVALAGTLPNSAEFDPIRELILEFLPQLQGSVAQSVLASLQSRTAALGAATDLLAQTAADAEADARVLTFEKPRLIAAAVTNAIATAQQMRGAIAKGDYPQALEKAQALEALLAHAQSTIKG